MGGDALLSFPPHLHRGVVDEDGTATVHAMVPAALHFFAEGRLPRVGGDPVEVAIGGRSWDRWCSPRSAASANDTTP
jgi:hypothetical protein